VVFYKGLKKTLEIYGKIDDIKNEIKHLDKIVKEYGDDLPQNVRDALDKATNILQKLDQEGNSANNLLSVLKTAISSFPINIPLAVIVVICVVVPLAIAGVTINYELIELTISNNGCPTIPQVQMGLFSIPSINTDSSIDNIPLLRVIFNIVATHDAVTISAIGQSVHEPLPSEVKDVIFDGQSILGKSGNVDLGSQKNHQLVISCKP
jgi:uncharacterized protein (UPF0147 family)